MRLNFNNVGKGLEAWGDAIQARKVLDAQKQAMASAEAEAAASGGKGAIFDNLSGLKDGETAASVSQNATDFLNSMSPVDRDAAIAAFNKEQQGGLSSPAVSQDPGDRNSREWQDTLTRYNKGVPPLPGSAPSDSSGRAGLQALAPEAQTTGEDTLLGVTPSSSLAQVALAEDAKPRSQSDAKMTLSAVDRPKLDAMTLYHTKYAPNVVKTLLEQNKIAEAKAFEDWSRSSLGSSYGKTWSQAMLAHSRGDNAGALISLQELYNRQVPNGRYVTVKPGAKEGTYDVEVRDEKTNRVLGTPYSGKTEDIVKMGLGMSTPAEQFNYFTAKAAKAAELEHENKTNEAKNATALEVARTGAGKPTGAAADMAVWNEAYDQLQTAQASGDKNAIARAQARLDFLNSRTSGLGLANYTLRREINAADVAGSRAAGEHAQIKVNELNRQITDQQKIINGKGGTAADMVAKARAGKRVKELQDDLVRWEEALQKARASGHYK